MTSLRERLEAKQRRRVVVPVQVTDPTSARNIQHGALAALQVARNRETPDAAEITAAEKAVEAASAAVTEHYVEVELQSLPAAEWEAAAAQFAGDGDVNWTEALPPLLAASCVDAELRDEKFWSGLLAGDSWSDGDRDQLRRALLHLNVTAADPVVPKD